MKLAAVIETGSETTMGLRRRSTPRPISTCTGAERRASEYRHGCRQVRAFWSCGKTLPNIWRGAMNAGCAQLLVNGTDPNTARLMQGYVQGAFAVWLDALTRSMRARDRRPDLQTRYWYNPQLRSADFIVPVLSRSSCR